MISDNFQEYDDHAYGLRKNPKKTCRVTVSDQEQSNNDIETRILTRCYLKRQRDECTSHDFEKKQLGFDPFCPVRKKRSKVGHKVSRFCNVSGFFGSGSKFSDFNGEEEVALSMVMLSSGFTKWDEFISEFDSSEKDVLISKAKFLNGTETELNVESDEANYENECEEAGLGDHDTESGVRLNSFDSSFGDFVSGNAFVKPVTGDDFDTNFSNSGMGKGNKVIKSQETSFDDAESGGFVEIDGIGIDGSVATVTDGFVIKGIDDSAGMVIDGFVRKGIECFAGMLTDGSFGTKTDDSIGKKTEGLSGTKIDNFSGKKIDVSAGAEIVGAFSSEIDCSVSEISENCDNKPEFKYKTYQRRIPSFQALEDDWTKKCDRKACEMANSYKQKKNKYIHECSICFKVFPTGPALGGHKRAHYNGLTENKNKERALMCQESVLSFAGFPFGEQFGSTIGLSL